jgi:hypothetical protein
MTDDLIFAILALAGFPNKAAEAAWEKGCSEILKLAG